MEPIKIKTSHFVRNRFDESYGNSAGFTLVEIAVVVLLFGIMALLVLQRTNSIGSWREEQGLRKFLNTWQFVFSEAIARGEGYRLVVDLDRQQYWVLREVPESGTVARQVDYLRNLRAKSEQERRDRAEHENLPSIEEEFSEADKTDSKSLEVLYYDTAYRDPYGSVRLGRPLNAPSLADPIELPSGIRIRDIKLQSETHTSGQVAIRFQSQGAADFALVHLQRENGEIESAILNPSTGNLMLQRGDIDYDWKLGQQGGK